MPGTASNWQGIDLAWPSLAINKHTELNVKLSLLNDIVLFSTTGPSRVFFSKLYSGASYVEKLGKNS